MPHDLKRPAGGRTRARSLGPPPTTHQVTFRVSVLPRNWAHAHLQQSQLASIAQLLAIGGLR
jgi:hypothetical protein